MLFGGNCKLGRYLDMVFRILVSALLFLPIMQSYAQVLPVADLSLEISLDPPDRTDSGDMGQFTLTYSNAGPDGVIPVARFQVVGQPVVFFGTGGCPLTVTDISGLPPNPTTFIYGLGPNRLLLPNESIECSGGYSVDPSLTSFVEVNWEIRVSNFQGTDPNLANNFVAIVFGSPGAVPVPVMKPWASTTLILIILMMLFVKTRRGEVF